MKTNKDVWKRHRGGKCPVSEGVMVDVRYRDGGFETANASLLDWEHDGQRWNIMSWRLHKIEDMRPTEADPRVSAAKSAVSFDPIDLRDAIRKKEQEISDSLETIEKWRSEIQCMHDKLKAEGFALLDVPKPEVDMSDPSNWRVGDKVIMKTPWFNEITKEVGKTLTICDILEYNSSRTVGDRYGIQVSEFMKKHPGHRGYERNFEFHSRP